MYTIIVSSFYTLFVSFKSSLVIVVG